MLQKVVAQVRMFAKDELHQMPETRIKEMQLGLETWHSIWACRSDTSPAELRKLYLGLYSLFKQLTAEEEERARPSPAGQHDSTFAIFMASNVTVSCCFFIVSLSKFPVLVNRLPPRRLMCLSIKRAIRCSRRGLDGARQLLMESSRSIETASSCFGTWSRNSLIARDKQFYPKSTCRAAGFDFL